MKKQAVTAVNVEARIRTEKQAAGIYLCPARCPLSLYYCTFSFLTKKHFDKHVTAGDKCSFPQGLSSIDRVIDLASVPGGMMMVETHRDWKKTSETTLKFFPSSEDPAADDACCLQAFHERRTKLHTTRHANSKRNLTGSLPFGQRNLQNKPFR